MSQTVKRIDPRRPASVGPTGLRRIELSKVVRPAPDKDAKPFRTTVQPAHWHMAIVFSERGGIDEPSRQAIAAAAILAASDTGVLVVVLGDLTESLGAAGADLVAVLPAFSAARLEPERQLAAVRAFVESHAPRHIFMADAASGSGDLGRRLSVRLGLSAATHVGELDAHHAASAGTDGTVATIAPLPRLVLLTSGAVQSNLPFVGKGALLGLAAMPPAASVSEPLRDLGLEEASAASVPLEEAGFIVSAGHGVSNTGTLATLAAALGAAIGASRVAVDEGKYPRDKQIGATGKTVSASAYIAVGISGAVQHLQGIKDCRHVIAINKDAGAPIIKRADLSIIGDAEDVMQALITRIAQAQAQRQLPEGS